MNGAIGGQSENKSELEMATTPVETQTLAATTTAGSSEQDGASGDQRGAQGDVSQIPTAYSRRRPITHRLNEKIGPHPRISDVAVAVQCRHRVIPTRGLGLWHWRSEGRSLNCIRRLGQCRPGNDDDEVQSSIAFRILRNDGKRSIDCRRVLKRNANFLGRWTGK